MAACAVRPIETIRCFSPNANNRESFARSMSTALGCGVHAVTAPEMAVKDADIVMCATNTVDPVFFAPWIESGMHVSSIKRPEIEAAAIKRADRVVIHTRDTRPIHVLTDKLVVPERADGRGWEVAADIDFNKFPTLPELIAGRAKGRGSDDEVTCFVNNLGLGYQFAAVGALLYCKAKESGAGRELPTDWFTQDVHP
jgi:ornithine cyclodeaminase/alanine dehydrogenase-like protein (mu-crystallin family)